MGDYYLMSNNKKTKLFNSLTKFNKELVDAYLRIPYVETKCGYACSDQYVKIKAVSLGKVFLIDRLVLRGVRLDTHQFSL